MSPMIESAHDKPRTATRIGRPMAIRLPSTIVRITIAAARPTTSLLSVAGSLKRLPMEPPAST